MRAPRQPLWTVLIALAIGGLSFVYRFNTLGGPLAGFDNDHFFQIVRAEAMLDGELPLRDYADAELRSIWPPLTYATSAVAMKTMGRSLRSEAMLSVGMIALGMALLFWTAATVSGAIVPAAILTLLAVGLSPTLYNYPKIVPYVLALIAMLAYARHPGRWRLLAVAAATVVGILYRHDHGVYLGLASTVLILLVNGRQAARPAFTYAGFVLIGLLPGLLFVQQQRGLITYLRECLETSQHEVGRTAAAPRLIQIDTTQRLLVRVPAPAPAPPRIAVRWDGTVTPEQRAVAERQLGLDDPQQRGDGQNWSYAVRTPTAAALAAIVDDARVADTDGIDRQAFTITAAPPPLPARGGLFGWRFAPGLLNEANAAPWLFLVAWSVVLASLVCLAWPPLRRASDDPAVPWAFLVTLTLLGALVCFVFLRNPAAYRLPDASVPVVVLGAWLIAAVTRAARSQTPAVRSGVAALLAGVLVLSILSVGAIGAVREQIVGSGVTGGVTAIAARARTVGSMLHGLPASTNGIDETLAAAAEYLRRCTRPADRLLVTGNVPEMNYFARRGVAAGQSVFFGGFYTESKAQREAVERWTGQSVPIALLPAAEHFDEEFGSDYPILAEQLRLRYRRAGALGVRSGLVMDVWVDRQRPAQPDSATGLPCFAD